MAYYLVTANPIEEKLPTLQQKLEAGEIAPLRPFGTALDYSLRNARVNEDGQAVWEEEDYCRPPLAMERQAVLDHYFTNLSVEPVTEGAGWRQIENLPSLWPEKEN